MGNYRLFAQRSHLGEISKDSVYCKDIRSVFLTRDGIELEPPILHLGTNEKIMLRFDELGPQASNFRYRIMHCDRDWRVDDLEPYEFINGSEDGPIENHQFSFTTMQDYVNYHQLIPTPYSSLTISGNFRLEVYPQDEPDSIVLTRRFYVVESVVDLELSQDIPHNASGNINTHQEINLSVTPRKDAMLSIPPQYLTIKIQQNNRTDLIHEVPFSGYLGNAMQFRWSEQNLFPGGNCFRYFDISNIYAAMYNVQEIREFGGETMAFLRPMENRSRSVFSLDKSLNGGMKINIFDRNNPQVEADYIWVYFSLPVEQPFFDGQIYIVGDFNDWGLNENNRMEYQPQYKAYTHRMHLKQGYYSYQLLFLPKGEKVGLTSRLEGDHFATPNNYTAYVYLRLPNDRFDRLIGVVRK